MSKQPYLFERLSKEDPNYELVKNRTLHAWAESHRLVAGAYDGRGSLRDFFETCVHTFSHGADILVGLVDPSISGKCEELDGLGKQCIDMFRDSLLQESKRFGEAYVSGLVAEFSHQVSAIAARSKQQICERELDCTAEPQLCATGAPILAAATYEDTGTGAETPLESSTIGASPRLVGWEDVKIEFISDERVRVTIGPRLQTLNYGEMGFDDKRSGKPNQLWGMFRALAQAGGTVPNAARNSKDFAAMLKRFERLRKKLKAHFHIASDPIPLDSTRGYCCRFTIGCALAFRS